MSAYPAKKALKIYSAPPENILLMDLFAQEEKAYQAAKRLLPSIIGLQAVVLEAGCGGGEFLRQLAFKYPKSQFIGLDPYTSFSQDKNITFLPQKAESLADFVDKVDVIFTIMSLHHFDDKDKFIENAASALKLSGKLLIIDWRKGIDTGIKERYFSLNEIEKSLLPYFRIIRSELLQFHFLILAEKI